LLGTTVIQRSVLVNTIRRFVCPLLVVLAPLAFAADLTVGSATYADRVTVGNTELVLNGAGIRHKYLFEIYAAGLYATKPSQNANELLADPQKAKRIRIVILRSDVDLKDIGKSFIKAIQDNAQPQDHVKFINGYTKIGGMFAEQKKVAKGAVQTMDWVPGTGMVVSVDGKVLGEVIPEYEFYQAMLRMYIGAKPLENSLKQALLGIK
jgi:Chalcone isomerase-like